MSQERIVKAPKHTGKVTRIEAGLAVKVVRLQKEIEGLQMAIVEAGIAPSSVRGLILKAEARKASAKDME